MKAIAEFHYDNKIVHVMVWDGRNTPRTFNDIAPWELDIPWDYAYVKLRGEVKKVENTGCSRESRGS